MAGELDEFLGDAEVHADAPVEAVAPVEADAPAAEAAEGAAAPAEAAAKEEPAAPEPEDVTGLKSALQATRRERADHKGRADRLDGEAAALRAELEALRKAAAPAPAAAPVAAPAPEPQAIPSPLEDPQGYHQYMQRTLFNERLNASEIMLRESVDGADVDAKMAVFKKAAESNSDLRKELSRQPHPYRWAYQQAQKIMAMEEIGTDPAAFRAKVEAEIRAQVEAELAGSEPAAGAAAGRVAIPRSLSTVRSSGSRTAPVMNIPESLDEILATPRRG